MIYSVTFKIQLNVVVPQNRHVVLQMCSRLGKFFKRFNFEFPNIFFLFFLLISQMERNLELVQVTAIYQ